MPARIRTTAKADQILAKIPRHKAIHQEAIEQGLFDAGVQVTREIRRLILSGPKTGRLYRIKGRRRRHRASAPGEPPANLTGRLRRGYDFQVHGFARMSIVNKVPYALFLELGTRRIAPRPHVSVAIRNTQREVENILNEAAKDKL